MCLFFFLFFLLFHVDKGFYYSLSQNRKAGMREQPRCHKNAVQYINLHVPNYCV